MDEIAENQPKIYGWGKKDSIMEIAEDNDICFILDIDNTLIKSENISYGSVEWRDQLIQKNGFAFGVSKWQHVLGSIKMIPVEGEQTVKRITCNIQQNCIMYKKIAIYFRCHRKAIE